MQGRKDVNVKKVTSKYEIIEVNGFAIKRRKSETKEKTTPGSQVGQITGGTTSQVFQTPVDTKTVETPVQRTPNVDEYEISVELYDRLTKALHEFPESGPSSARLLAICSSVCGAEMDTVGSQLDGTTLGCLESIFGDFLNKLSQAVDDGSIQVAENVPDDGLTEADFKVDIRSRKLGLQRRLDMLEKEEQEWNDLLEKVDSINLEKETPSSEGEYTKHTEMASEEIRELKELKESLQKQASLQVEAVSLIVGNIEDLIEKANDKANEAQQKYHSERLKAFPHINSPAKLIKAIVRRQPET